MPKLSLHIEPLEPRLAMDGSVTASLSAGVLAISGTTGEDTITLSYNASQVTIVELNQSFLLPGVTSIDVATGGGDDTVKLHFDSPKKPKWMGVALTIHANGGNDRLIDAIDNKYFLGGQEDVLTISRKGDTRLSGQKLTWFDSNVADEALREWAEDQYTDKVLSRDDMLALFEAAGVDQFVTGAEYVSLQAIAGNRSLFRKLDHVYALSNYLVGGAPRNPDADVLQLHHLMPGASGLQLELLVDKWFLGKSHPDSTDLETGEQYAYRNVAGTLFVNGPTFDDIEQGALGDCYLLAGLAAIAVHSPEPIENMFIVNGDGTYTVRFFNGSTPYYVTVDTQLPVDAGGRLIYAGVGKLHNDPGNELWVSLAEKAYAQFAESGWLDTGGLSVNSYSAINAGWPADAMTQVTGKTTIDLLQLDRPSDVVKSFASGRAVTFITLTVPVSLDVIENHVYALIDYNAQTREFVLFNPWGLSNPGALSILNLSWEQAQENFYSWDFGPKV